MRKNLLTISEISDYLKDNESDYLKDNEWRCNMCFMAALKTCFTLHNETFNIWTHLFGAILFGFYAIKQCCWWPMLIHNLCVTCLFLISSTFHLLSCISDTCYYSLRTLDFIAIIVTMWSKFLPVTWPDIQIASLIAFVSACIALTPQFHRNDYHIIRVLTFAMNGVWGVILMWKYMQDVILMAYGAVGLHLIGAIFYATKFPEKQFPFEIFHYFQSHTFFHCFVLGGFILYNKALQNSVLNPISTP
jgi:adiponectin receptor